MSPKTAPTARPVDPGASGLPTPQQDSCLGQDRPFPDATTTHDASSSGKHPVDLEQISRESASKQNGLVETQQSARGHEKHTSPKLEAFPPQQLPLRLSEAKSHHAKHAIEESIKDPPDLHTGVQPRDTFDRNPFRSAVDASIPHSQARNTFTQSAPSGSEESSRSAAPASSGYKQTAAHPRGGNASLPANQGGQRQFAGRAPSGNGSEDEDRSNKRQRILPADPDQSMERRLACPFYKRDSAYQASISCRGPGFNSISTLR